MEAVILSAGLDTNGQNARFVEAARKLNVVALGDYDPASVVGRYVAAADRDPRLRIRSIHRQTHIYQGMPADVLWTRQNEKDVRRMVVNADVLHLNNSYRPLQLLRIGPRGRPTLLHHHGSLFRSNPNTLFTYAERHGYVQAVSTIDLSLYDPERLHWLPTAYDLDALAEIRDRHYVERDTLRIVTCPTNRSLKSTDLLSEAVNDLLDQGLDIELIIVEGKAWADAIAIKATADVLFDQTLYGYGCNGVEAFGMAIPVIAGADDPAVLDAMRQTFGSTLPFVVAESNVPSIQDAIRALYRKPARTKYGKLGRKHAERWHAERPALDRLVTLYGLAIERYDATVDAVVVPPSVRFTADVAQLYVAGRFVTFRGKEPVAVDNPFIVARLRVLAQRSPHYGITEIE